MRKLKTFNYSNSYIESKISEVIGIKTERMAYDEDGARYYYWYDKDNYEIINEKRHMIEFVVNKVENRDIMIGLVKESEIHYKDCCMLIVGIVND